MAFVELMKNGIDPSAHISNLEFSDEKQKIIKILKNSGNNSVYIHYYMQ